MPNIAICERCDLFIRNEEECRCTSSPIVIAKFGAAFPPKGPVEEYSRRGAMPNCKHFAEQLLADEAGTFKRNLEVCQACPLFHEQNTVGYRKQELMDTPRFVCGMSGPDCPIPLRVWHAAGLHATCLYHERQYGEARSREVCNAIRELTEKHPEFRGTSDQIGEKLSEWGFPQDFLSQAIVAASGLIGSKEISIEALVDAGGPALAHVLRNLKPETAQAGWARIVYAEEIFGSQEGAEESKTAFLACASRLKIPVGALLIQAAWMLLSPAADKRIRLLPYVSGFHWLLRKFEDSEQPDLAVQAEKYRVCVENCLRDLETLCGE